MAEWEKYIRQVVPYVPGEQPDKAKMIKLNTNENPYPPAPGVVRALKEMRVDNLRLYPDPTCSSLIKVLAEYYGLGEDRVFVGVGSDDVLAMAFLTFFNSEKPVLFPAVSYSFYRVWADLYRIPYECPALDPEFRIRPEDYKRENGGIVFPNPNAPTSVFLPLDQVEEMIRYNRDVVVIVDEAYIDFGGESAVKLTDKYENLLVVQTFSKSRSLAGMRIGYALGNPKLIKALHDVKYSFNSYTMNRTALTLGVEAVKDEAYFRENLAKILATRERVSKRMRELGFEFPESYTNFLFASHRRVPAKKLFDALRKRDIYVRHFDAPGIDRYLRITVGTDEEMDAFLNFVEGDCL
ncbi:MAG: histidinol-phosphate transaminase [Lachnospiraceae bacterium]|nr:histidinol-phosphate transaminase [Lachnospiraceae bacterium]